MSEPQDARIYRSLPRAKRLLSLAALLSLILAILFTSLVIDAVRTRSFIDPAALGYASATVFLLLAAFACVHLALRTVVTDSDGITLANGPRKRRVLWSDVQEAGYGRFSIVLNLANDRSMRVFLPAEGFGPPERMLRTRNRLLADIYGRIGEEVIAYGWLDRPITARERRNFQTRAVVLAREVVELPQPAHRFDVLLDLWRRGGDDPMFVELLERWDEVHAGFDSTEEMMRSFAHRILEAWDS